jgi:hypothetical protein
MTKREWQIEMANRFAKRDNVNIEELDTRSYLLGRYDSTKELTDAQNTIRQLAEKLECYERLADASEMASNPMSIKSRVMLKNVGEMKTIMTKEALAQPEQEPVAWMNDSTPSGIFARHMEGAKNFGCTIPLYTAPPQREWVGLTDEERANCSAEAYGRHFVLCELIEAKLKEKNT